MNLEELRQKDENITGANIILDDHVFFNGIQMNDEWTAHHKKLH